MIMISRGDDTYPYCHATPSLFNPPPPPPERAHNDIAISGHRQQMVFMNAEEGLRRPFSKALLQPRAPGSYYPLHRQMPKAVPASIAWLLHHHE